MRPERWNRSRSVGWNGGGGFVEAQFEISLGCNFQPAMPRDRFGHGADGNDVGDMINEADCRPFRHHRHGVTRPGVACFVNADSIRDILVGYASIGEDRANCDRLVIV